LGQKINISYTIDIEELPTEVERLLGRGQKLLSSISLDDIATEDLLEHKTYEKVNSVRARLAEIDYCMGDIAAIIASYNNYRLQSSTEEEASVDTPLSALESKLADFKKSVGANEIPS
jgi:hypothetical protein